MSTRGRGGTKRQRKSKDVGENSQPEDLSDRFLDDEAQKKFYEIASKEVRRGKVLNASSSFDAFGMNVLSLFKHQGLDKFLALESPVYPSLVREFYANLRTFFDDSTGRHDPHTLVTRVNKVDIIFTENELAKWLEIPIDDDQLEITRFNDITLNDPSCDLIEELNKFSLHRYTHYGNVRVVHLTLQARLIARVIMYNLCPKSGTKDQITKFPIYLTAAILSKKKINWAGFLFNQIRDMFKRRDANLQFGIALTKVFRENNVDLSNTEIRKLSKKYDYFNESTIIAMGFKLVNGEWVPSGEIVEESDEEIPDAEPSNRELMIEIKNFQASTDHKLDKILRRLHRLEMERVAENPNYFAPASDDDV